MASALPKHMGLSFLMTGTHRMLAIPTAQQPQFDRLASLSTANPVRPANPDFVQLSSDSCPPRCKVFKPV
jgi:hypothetical protein